MNSVALKVYVDTCIKGIEDKLAAQAEYTKLQARLTAEAVKKAEESMNLRMENTNEWRGQSKDREATYATKDSLTPYDKRLTKLENSNAFSAGKTWMILAVLTAVPTILALIALYRS